MITTPFWFSEPNILYEKDYLFEIFPFKRFDIVRKLNAVMRLSIYYTLIMYLIKRDNHYLMIPIVTSVITYIIWKRQKDTNTNEIMKESMNNTLEDLVKINDLNTECTVPTKDNPFMNPELFDYGNNKPLKSKSCSSYNNIGMQRRIEELFNEDLYREVTDIFSTNNSQRQFFTVPNNQIPSDQGSFAQWLYGTPPTCKEGTNPIACLSQGGSAGPGPSSN